MSALRDIDNGYAAFYEALHQDRQAAKVHVGIFARDGARQDADGAALIDIAVWNEFGVPGHVPERSFIRAWVDEHVDEIQEALRRLMTEVAIGKLSKEKALNRFGLWVQGEIQKRIAGGIAPANKAFTIEQKKSSVPLIHRGQLRSSITYAVDLGNGEVKEVDSQATTARARDAKAKARAQKKADRKAWKDKYKKENPEPKKRSWKKVAKKAAGDAKREAKKRLKDAKRVAGKTSKAGKKFGKLLGKALGKASKGVSKSVGKTVKGVSKKLRRPKRKRRARKKG